ncbi:fumarylacetoacetate hydrolase family protein [Salinactinospora qingdaonensis]|uniref:Fumarylacetoacetase-like C-terminal domain-containing protein n=1 Tax=Salinactinospora qingdaonensis TaxID=702744 RepID=A0ABP7FT44_9ACTN
MKLTAIRSVAGTRAARVDDNGQAGLGCADLEKLSVRPDRRALAALATASRPALELVEFAPAVPRASEAVCVGLNCRPHILKMGRDLPEHPTLLVKFAEALLGAADDIDLAPESDAVDSEAESTIVVGATVHRADEPPTADAVTKRAAGGEDAALAEWLTGRAPHAPGLGPWL